MRARNRNRLAALSLETRQRIPPRTPRGRQGWPKIHPIIATRGRIPPRAAHINRAHPLAQKISGNLERFPLKFYRGAGFVNIQYCGRAAPLGDTFQPRG